MLDTLSQQLNVDLTGWAGFGVIAVLIGLISFVVLRVFTDQPAPAEPAAKPGSESDVDLLALERRLTVEKQGRDEEQIAPELRQAGYYDPKALSRFQMIRTGLMLVPIFVTAFLVISVPPEWATRVLIYGLIAIVLGFSLPRIYVASRARARRRQIERGLPVALDLVSLGLVGGQNIQGAFQRSADAVRPTFPALADEMQLVLRQAELKTFPMALEQWADRAGVPEVQNVSVAVGQADRLGVNVADALMELATNFRVGMRQKADAAASRAGVWMLFPTILCLWIPSGLVLAAPIIFEFQDRRAKAKEMIRKVGDPDADANSSLKDAFGKQLGEDAAVGPPPPPPPGL
ncbi:MAG TPA: type II secretion system F family protein [Gemmataceae bacterium]|nr:type II secretion system F family protein [Gemmataceae bacterium]